MKGDSIPICRSIFNHWIYQDAEYLKVWVTMLGRAQYTPEPKTKIWKGITYTQHRGEFIFGRKQWNIDTGVSEDRLRRVIILLVKDNMIELVAFKGKFSMYKIINYEKFNQPRSKEVTGLDEDEPPTEPQQDPNTPPTEPQQTTTIKKVKKDKNVSSTPKRTIVNEYHDLYLQKYKSKPVVSGKVAIILQGIAKEIGQDDAVHRLKLFFADSSEYVTKSFHAPEMFRARINQYVTAQEQELL